MPPKRNSLMNVFPKRRNQKLADEADVISTQRTTRQSSRQHEYLYTICPYAGIPVAYKNPEYTPKPPARRAYSPDPGPIKTPVRYRSKSVASVSSLHRGPKNTTVLTASASPTTTPLNQQSNKSNKSRANSVQPSNTPTPAKTGTKRNAVRGQSVKPRAKKSKVTVPAPVPKRAPVQVIAHGSDLSSDEAPGYGSLSENDEVVTLPPPRITRKSRVVESNNRRASPEVITIDDEIVEQSFRGDEFVRIDDKVEPGIMPLPKESTSRRKASVRKESLPKNRKSSTNDEKRSNKSKTYEVSNSIVRKMYSTEGLKPVRVYGKLTIEYDDFDFTPATKRIRNLVCFNEKHADSLVTLMKLADRAVTRNINAVNVKAFYKHELIPAFENMEEFKKNPDAFHDLNAGQFELFVEGKMIVEVPLPAKPQIFPHQIRNQLMRNIAEALSRANEDRWNSEEEQRRKHAAETRAGTRRSRGHAQHQEAYQALHYQHLQMRAEYERQRQLFNSQTLPQFNNHQFPDPINSFHMHNPFGFVPQPMQNPFIDRNAYFTFLAGHMPFNNQFFQ